MLTPVNPMLSLAAIALGVLLLAAEGRRLWRLARAGKVWP